MTRSSTARMTHIVEGDRPLEPPRDRLSAIDRQVVDIALRDTRFSVPSRDRVMHFLQRRLHGRRRQLADPRLEALRRYLVLYRQIGDTRDTEHEVQVLAAGYSEAQVRAAEALTDVASRGRATPRGIWSVVGLVMCVPVLGLMAAGLADWLDNLTIALIVLGTVVVTLMSVGAGRSGVMR